MICYLPSFMSMFQERVRSLSISISILMGVSIMGRGFRYLEIRDLQTFI